MEHNALLWVSSEFSTVCYSITLVDFPLGHYAYQNKITWILSEARFLLFHRKRKK